MEPQSFNNEIKKRLLYVLVTTFKIAIILWISLFALGLIACSLWDIFVKPNPMCPYECIGYCEEVLDDNSAFFEIKCVYNQSIGVYNQAIEGSDLIVGNNYTLYANCRLKSGDMIFSNEFSLDPYYYLEEYDWEYVRNLLYLLLIDSILCSLSIPLLYIIFSMCVYYDFIIFTKDLELYNEGHLTENEVV